MQTVVMWLLDGKDNGKDWKDGIEDGGDVAVDCGGCGCGCDAATVVVASAATASSRYFPRCCCCCWKSVGGSTRCSR